jgi:hypothetical protein
MKKIDLNTFVYNFFDEIRQFEEKQTTFDPAAEKTMEEWVNQLMIYCGYEEEDEEESLEDYDDSFDYLEDLGFQEVVNRKKYRSFRDDDRY